MIRVDNGEVDIQGDSKTILAELMIVTSAMRDCLMEDNQPFMIFAVKRALCDVLDGKLNKVMHGECTKEEAEEIAIENAMRIFQEDEE